ncbi:ATP-dependent helicase HrpB [Aeromonas australiensis]|uniref:ATP-dependent helicase HrpB n=1 Tax=Aeromonas australiensis TaxID=1114880 RepID=UPI001F24FF1C|nr:ATP-dependent helicase HrpB [Aeromonas australiensis]MCF3096237.1 ATP-dependent helicase HrpB [Aeromonas australiensis]
MSQLPILSVLPELFAALDSHTSVILQAPPGAGKSTLLPLELVRQNRLPGRIIMLEPRRLAARNIASFLARQLGEKVGERIGLRVRGESRTSSATRLEIVTEGVLTRMLQQDPELTGVSLVIFDEFHERSLHADTALAFAIESQQGLRDDLKLLVMSATLDGMALEKLLPDAPVVRSEGRGFPIDYHYRPANRQQWLEPQVGAVVLEALAAHRGSLLVFLPGQGEIERLAQWLQGGLADKLPDDVTLAPLYGRLDMTAQQAAIEPAPAGRRKLVLTTNVAETSLTIEGVSVVIDCGLERRASFDLKSGVTRLETRQIAKSSATQRAGRAGRLGPGVCYRLWSSEVQERLAEQSPPDILTQELTGLLIDAAQWGAKVEDLPLLDMPPAAAVACAQRLLVALGAMKPEGEQQLTPAGRAMAAFGTHPRLARMLLRARELEADGLTGVVADAAYLVALQDEDLRGSERLSVLFHRRQGALRQGAARWFERLGARPATAQGQWLGLLCALAWPDRIGKLRSGNRYQLSGGVSCDLVEGHPCQGQAALIAIEMGQNDRGSRIFIAEPVDLDELVRLLPELVSERQWFDWDEREERVRAERQQVIGELVLSQRPLTELSDEQKGRCLLQGIRRKGLHVLPWDESSEGLLARLRCAHDWLPEEGWPAVDEGNLLATLEQWLLPAVNGMTRLDQLKKLNLGDILRQALPWPLPKRLNEALPSHFAAPTGSRVRIRYQPGQAPVIPVRIQEMFGQGSTPCVADGRVPLVVELLSPAQRPLQITADLAAFWAGSYEQVKKEMKGRYPRHYWPDNPLEAMPTRVTKKKMGM